MKYNVKGVSTWEDILQYSFGNASSNIVYIFLFIHVSINLSIYLSISYIKKLFMNKRISGN